MGLDITYYKGVVKNENPKMDEYGYPEGETFKVWENPSFPGRSHPLIDGAFYDYNSDDNHCDSFYCGYGAHYRFRDNLAELAGYPEATSNDDRGDTGHHIYVWQNPKPGPFYELIYFSDCEGIIGSDAATRLSKDFAQYQEKANQIDEEYFKELYSSWRKAFEYASESGAVLFH